MQNPQTYISETDVDVLLTFHPHNWSSICWMINQQTFRFAITHVFSNPYTDLLYTLKKIVKEQPVCWEVYDEPGGMKMQCIPKSPGFIQIELYRFEELVYKEPKTYHLEITFEISVRQLLLLFYYQLKKINELMRNKDYAGERTGFPFQEFYIFEKSYKGLK